MSGPEQQHILAVLHAPAYVDKTPHTVFAMLLDSGRYLASVSTFYRLLRGVGAARGRRDQLTHPTYTKPELLATSPRELWSWDISVPQQAAWEMRVWPLAFGLQEQDANHRKRRGSKAPVVSVAEKVP